MCETYYQFAQIGVAPAGVELLLEDLMIFGASLFIACVIGRFVLLPGMGRMPMAFWAIGAIAIGCGLFEVAWLAPSMFSIPQIHAIAVIASIILLVIDALLLVRLLSSRRPRTR